MNDSRSSEEKDKASYHEDVKHDPEAGGDTKVYLEQTASSAQPNVQWTVIRCIAIASLCIAYIGQSVLFVTVCEVCSFENVQALKYFSTSPEPL